MVGGESMVILLALGFGLFGALCLSLGLYVFSGIAPSSASLPRWARGVVSGFTEPNDGVRPPPRPVRPRRGHGHHHRFRQLNPPAYRVGRSMEVPWERIDSCHRRIDQVEVGKRGRGSSGRRRQRGIWSHLGRCNTRRRFRHAIEVGYDGATAALSASFRTPASLWPCGGWTKSSGSRRLRWRREPSQGSNSFSEVSPDHRSPDRRA